MYARTFDSLVDSLTLHSPAAALHLFTLIYTYLHTYSLYIIYIFTCFFPCFLYIFLCVPLDEALPHTEAHFTLWTQCVYPRSYHWFLASTVGTPQLFVSSGAFDKRCLGQVVTADELSSLKTVWPHCNSPAPIHADSGDGAVPLQELEGDVVDELPEEQPWFEWIGRSTEPRIESVQHGQV